MGPADGAGGSAPGAGLGACNDNARERVEIRGGRRELVLDIAERRLPTLRAKDPERRWADRTQTVLAGQSLGGLTALSAARHAPAHSARVLLHPPYTRLMPGPPLRPTPFTRRQPTSRSTP
ncbi:alpha/beta hydrolase-fold protein, partial [Salmonella enterica]|uniref:alpha/beta hydrolase-fold protein n=1 Tax=Salmonella enterica TaxID=28901 RepID=UPI00398C7973